MTAKKILTWTSGPLLALVFLWIAFRGVSMEEFSEALQKTDLLLLGLAMATVILHLVLRAQRWRPLLASHGRRVPYLELLSAVSIGFMASLLPARVGEVLRPVLLSRRTGTPYGTTIATVGAERALLDIMAVFALGGLGILLPRELNGLAAGSGSEEMTSTIRAAGGVVLSVSIAALVVVHVVARRRDAVASWVGGIAQRSHSKIVAKIIGAIASLLPGIDGFATVAGLLRLLAETAVIWFVITLGNWLGLVACGVDIPFAGSMIMLPILAVGIAAGTPGGTGTYHYAMIAGLTSLFAVREPNAVVAAIVVHAMTWLPVMALGGLFIARGGLQKRPVTAGAAETSEPVEEVAR